MSPYNVVADGEAVDCLYIDAQTYNDLTVSLEHSAQSLQQYELEEEANINL